MAMMLCPACKKQVSVDAAACPKCGHPITDEERVNGKRPNKVARMGCLIFLFVFVIGAFFAYQKDKATGAEVTAVRQTIVNGSMSDWDTAPLVKGVAVLVNDSAAYWVREGRVYAVNGMAAQLSEGVADAPASIDMQKVQSALQGKPVDVSLLFALSPEELVERINAKLAEADVPLLKKSTPLSYELQAGGRTCAQLSMTELGGEVKDAIVDVSLVKGQNLEALRLCQAFMAVLSADDTENNRNVVLQSLFNDAFAEYRTLFMARVNTVQYSMAAASKSQVYLQASPMEE